MKNFYVYLLLDPRKYYKPFYVGKGKNTRCYDHLTESKSSNRHKFNTIKSIRKSGQEPVILFWEVNLSEPEAFRIEIELIKRFGRRDKKTGMLTNMTDGGEGSIGRIGLSGPKNGMYGKTHTPEARENIRRANKERAILGLQTRHSEEHKQNLRNYNAGGIATSHPVYQIGENGHVIREWPSFKSAQKKLNLKGNTTRVWKDGSHYRLGGFWWREVGSIDVVNGYLTNRNDYVEKLNKPSSGKRCAKIDPVTKGILHVYESMKAAAKDSGLSYASLWIAEKQGRIFGNYRWKKL